MRVNSLDQQVHSDPINHYESALGKFLYILHADIYGTKRVHRGHRGPVWAHGPTSADTSLLLALGIVGVWRECSVPSRAWLLPRGLPIQPTWTMGPTAVRYKSGRIHQDVLRNSSIAAFNPYRLPLRTL